MSELSSESCEACRVGAPIVPEADRPALMAQIPEWTIEVVDGIDQLSRAYSFKNFVEALAFANKVGELAESMDHHPAILVEWGRVKVSWWTHKIKGLHRNDFVCAAKTDALSLG